MRIVIRMRHRWNRARTAIGFVLALLVALLVHAFPAAAHELSTSYALLGVEGPQVEIAFTINGLELHNGPALDTDADGIVTEAEARSGLDAFVGAIVSRYAVALPGSPPVEPELEGWRFIAENVLEFTFVYAFERDASEVHLVSRLDEITQSDHRHLLQIGTDTDARQTILSRDYPEITIDYTMGIPLWVTAYEFLVFGVEHIVTGYDHLAFLAGVIMATSGLVALAKVVTAFTLGHSVTLVLASLDVVTMPSRFIESIIALSIVYVALENFLGRKLVERWVLTFLFGLIHGFGFSNVLRELGLSSGRMVLSLFSFNLGVEVGQLAFVVVLFPLLLALGKTRWKEPVMAGVSVAVMSLGFYWFVQRAVFG